MSRDPGTRPTAIGRFMLLVLALVASSAAQAATDAGENLAGRIEQVMSARYPPDQPGAAVLAARNGEIAYRGGFGLASMELRVPVQPEMVFGLASITKLFTALGAMMLVEDGSLKLDDEIVDYLPELSKTKGATIANLLSHTSGLTGPVSEFPGYREEKFYYEISSRELIGSYADFELKFPPGERSEYSNEGIATLARIIEVVSGQSWDDFLQQRIFGPAGMASTYYAGHDRIIPMSVTGYTKHDEGWKRARYTSFTHGFGMGALFSNVDDMYRWYRALVSGQLVEPGTLATMLTPYPLNDGSEGRHGFGFGIGDIDGHRMAAHGGSHSGWNAFFLMLPDDGVFVIVLTNRSTVDGHARRDAMDILRLMLGGAGDRASQDAKG